MSQYGHLLLSFFMIIISISFVACHHYRKVQEDPLGGVYADDSPSIDDYGWTFKNFIKRSTTLFSSKEVANVNVGCTKPSLNKVNVNDYGAKGRDHDDTKAFKEAWEVACSSGYVTFMVPEGNYLLKPIRFSGPCKSDITVQISGTLEATDDPSDYSEDSKHWLVFDSVERLSINGGGTLNGNGNIWWKNSCKRSKKKSCNKNAPTALAFLNCKDLIVEDLAIENAQQMHVRIQDSVNVKASRLKLTAPESSPNTDGIHVTNSQNVQISSSVIGTGDDCISIVNGTSDFLATDITCGPGHGISIGSLGARGSKDFVSGIKVDGAKLSGTKNGVRIKTWQGGSGMASDIVFRNIEMDNVTNPIIIDQNYCDSKKPCKKQKSAVQIKNVLYQNITGTSACDVAVKLDCSETYPCRGIVLQDIDLQGEGRKYVEASCNNAELTYLGDVSPSCCT